MKTRTACCGHIFPKSSDLSAHSIDDLDWVAAELNDRPRKRLGFKETDRTDWTPAVALTANSAECLTAWADGAGDSAAQRVISVLIM